MQLSSVCIMHNVFVAEAKFDYALSKLYKMSLVVMVDFDAQPADSNFL